MLIRRDEARSRPFRIFAAPGPNGGARQTEDAPSPEGDCELALTSRVAALEDQLVQERAVREHELKAAFSEGSAAGRREAADRNAEKLEALRKALEQVGQDLGAKLDEKADVAVAIARAALQRILGEDSARREMVGEIVRQMAADVAAETLVRIRVSAEDFESDQEIAVLARSLPGISIERQDALPGGSCLLDLTLGCIDASLDVQSRSLDGQLQRFETAPGARS